MASKATPKSGKIRGFFKKKPVRITMKILSGVGKCLFTILLVGTLTVSIVACVAVVYVVTNFDGSEGLPDLAQLSLNETSIIYTPTADGSGWQENLRLEGTDSIWTDIEDIPLNMQNAVIAIEDKRFREHYGVDWKRTIAAFANLILHTSETEYGGSTITQQLIKVVTSENSHSIERKITEIMRAIYLERNSGYTKDDILEAYLNVLPLSGNIKGVGAAANAYFGKDVKDLSLAECALIAGITQNPSRFNPYTHPQNIRARQQIVLYQMYDQGLITEDEYLQAANEELVFKSNIRRVAVQDYYVDQVIEDVAADLMEKYGYAYDTAIHMVYYGGLKIYSYENPAMQQKVEAIYANEDNFPAHKEGDDEDPQGAIFIIDYNGRVVATAGGRGEKTADRVYNRSSNPDAARQPGSSFKPIATYAPAVSMNLVHFSSLVPNAPITLPNGKLWPPNYQSSVGDRGMVTLTVGLQKSLNTVSAQLLQKLTPQRSYDFLVNMLQFTTLDKRDIDYAPLALGGLTYGVTCREMAAAYQIFGNGGQYIKPVTYARVVQNEKELLKTQYKPVQVLDVNSAYIMNCLMQRVVTRGTAASIAGSWKGWEVYAKTGTSGTSQISDTGDVYFAGGTTQYVAASWFGYDYHQDLNSRQTRYARDLWNKCMVAIRDNNYGQKTFTQKGTTVERKFCTQTGQLVGPDNTCPSTDTGVYKPDFLPGYCETHVAGVGSTTEGNTTTGSSTTTGSTTAGSTTTTTTTTAPPAA